MFIVSKSASIFSPTLPYVFLLLFHVTTEIFEVLNNFFRYCFHKIPFHDSCADLRDVLELVDLLLKLIPILGPRHSKADEKGDLTAKAQRKQRKTSDISPQRAQRTIFSFAGRYRQKKRCSASGGGHSVVYECY